MDSRAETPRNLLFGILALQMDFITRDDLIAAMNEWVRDRHTALGQVLIRRGALCADDLVVLEPLVRRHMERHGGDAHASLASVSPLNPVGLELERIDDLDVRASMAATLSAADAADATGTFSARTAGETARFRVLRFHDRGGLGEIYVARDEELHRDVALKQMQERFAADLASRSRFVAEAEITGGLEHPGVIPVYGLGHFDDGRPFYAMRFIKGDSLREAIKQFHQAEGPGREPGERSLALRRLIGRFLDVCNAVEYAHSRGVLHRDLKPGNIMLGPYGETLVVDWGMAKVIGRPEHAAGGEATLRRPADSSHAVTIPGSVVGTPSYMSPEQAQGDLDSLGPASDVYSLGATLYHLLTGRAAFEPAEFSVMQTRIIAGEFPPPRQVNRSVPAALDAVCLKSMAREPGNRYSSPRALADDLEHWLADEPVGAWREPWAVRARRWLVRHRTLVTSGAAAASVGLAGLVALVVLQQWANQALHTSNLNLQAANAREQQAGRLAQTRYALARKAVEAYYTGASEDVLLKQPELEDLRKRLLQTALEFYREMATTLTDSPDNTPATREELAGAYFSVASITDQIGSKEDALAAFQRVRATLEDLLREMPDDDTRRGRLAECHQFLAYLSRVTGRRDEAARAADEALTLREELLKKHPHDASLLSQVASTLHSIGELQNEHGSPEKALRFYRQALARHDEAARLRPDDVTNQNNRAGVLHDIGLVQGRTNTEDGVRTMEEAIEVRRRIVRDDPNQDDYVKSLAASCNDLAGLLWRRARFDEALPRYQEALVLYDDLARRHPTVNDLRGRVATAHYNIGLVYSSLGRPRQALQSFRTSLPMREALAEAHPTVVAYKLGLSAIYFQLGYAHRRLGHLDEAMSWYGKALPLQQAAHRANPTHTEATVDLAWTCNNLGYLQYMTGRISEALRSYSLAVQYRRQLVDSDPSAFTRKRELAWSYNLLSEAKRDAGDTTGALEAIRQAVAIAESQARERAGDDGLKQLLTAYQLATAYILLRTEHTSEGLDLARQTAAAGEDDYRRNPADRIARWNRGTSLVVFGKAQLASGDPVAAQQAYEKARAFLESLTHPDESELFKLAHVYVLLSTCPAPGGPPANPAGQAARQALVDRAVEALRRAVAAGFRYVHVFRMDRDFDALRPRADFQALVSDMVFPADPFAR